MFPIYGMEFYWWSGDPEHLWAPSPIEGHQTTTGYLTTMENFNIIGGEDTWLHQDH